MILYVTDIDGNQYTATIESEETMVEDSAITGPRVIQKWVVHRVKITREVGEFNLSSNPTDDPAVTLERIYEQIKREIDN